MKILYHHRTQSTGAEGVHIAYVIKGFQELGYHVQVISPSGKEPMETAGGNPFAIKKGLKARVLGFLSRNLPQSMFEILEIIYNAEAYLKIKTAIQTTQIKFIYERYAFFSVAGSYLAEKFEIPFVVEANEIAGYKRVRRQCFVGLAQRMEQKIFDRATAILVVSEFLKEEIKKLDIDSKKIFVIPNAVDPKEFSLNISPESLKKRFGVPSETVTFGFIGWFVAWHNIELLIDVFAEVAQGRKVLLFLVGDGVLKEELLKRIRAKGVEDKVIFTGAVPYKQIPEYISLMDICVIPGSNEYRSPIKLFEYMAMAKAVVAPRLKPIESIVTHEQEGMLFEPDNADSLRKIFLKLLPSTETRRRLGENARRKILEHHTWLHNAQRVVDIVEKGSFS